MRPNLSLAFRQGATALHNPDGVYFLATITNAELPGEIYRLTDAPVNIDSRVGAGGGTFLRCPMACTLAEDSPDRLPQAQFTMANVDRRMVAALRSTTTPCDIKLEIVKISDPDYVEETLADFVLKDVEYNALTIQGALSIEALLDEPGIDYCFTPTIAPGLFK